MKNLTNEMWCRTPKKIMPHDKFMDRIRKSLYFGAETTEDEMEVSRPLAEYASELFSEPHKGHSLNRLHSVVAGNVHATPYSLIMALIYLERLNVTDPGYLRGITPQELFIVSMMVSTKFYAGLDEEFYLSDWAEDGDMTEERLKQLELQFLSAIEWNIYISNENFFNKLSHVEKILAQREGTRRGWLTYTELMQLLPSLTLLKYFLQNIMVMVVTYAAGVITIAGAFLLATQIPGNALYRKTLTTDIVKNTSNTLVQPVADVEHSQQQIACRDTVSVTISSDVRNDSCSALNAEAELLKLERQYREEAEEEDLRRRNSEIVNHWRVTLPAAAKAVQQLNNSKENAQLQHTQQLNWLAFKEEYSDRKQDDDQLRTEEINACYAKTYTNSYKRNSCNNSTNALFWQLIGHLVDKTLIHLPHLGLNEELYCLSPL